MKRYTIILIMICALLSLCGCSSSSKQSRESVYEILSKGQATPGASASNFRSRESREVVKTLHKNGFTNIWLKPSKDLSRRQTDRIGQVADVEIDGSNDFRASDVFENDVEVVVYWHCTRTWKNPKSIYVEDVDNYIDPWEIEDPATSQTDVSAAALTPMPSLDPVDYASQMALIGSVVEFGSYEQDNDTSNGQEPIRWIVLDTDGSKSLLISEAALDKKPYNNVEGNVTWETCSLRAWLNSDFLNTAFSDEEKTHILRGSLDNSNSDGWGTYGGNSTTDSIFLLSYGEGRKYLYGKDTMIAKASKYAESLGAVTNSSGATKWWLRSPADALNGAATGQMYGVGEWREYAFVEFENGAVRPAIWVDVTSFLP